MQRTEWMGTPVVYWTQANHQGGLMHKNHLATTAAKRFAHDSHANGNRLHEARRLPEQDNHRWNPVVNHGRERHSPD